MNKLFKIFSVIAMCSALIGLNACVKGDFDQPSGVPHVDFQSNTSISQLNAMHTTGGLEQITDDIIVQGVVVANDQSGNFYKQIIIQDDSAGIVIMIDKTDLFNKFKVGQQVYVKCKDMALSDYHGLIQLGYIIDDASSRLPEALISDHILLDELPGTPPAPINLTIPTITNDRLNMLIKLDNVHFADTGQVFSNSTGSTNRNILDENGNIIILRTSNYASFASSLIPAGTGSVTGILSIYDTDYQLYIRDLNDLQGFSN